MNYEALTDDELRKEFAIAANLVSLSTGVSRAVRVRAQARLDSIKDEMENRAKDCTRLSDSELVMKFSESVDRLDPFDPPQDAPQLREELRKMSQELEKRGLLPAKT